MEKLKNKTSAPVFGISRHSDRTIFLQTQATITMLFYIILLLAFLPVLLLGYWYVKRWRNIWQIKNIKSL